MPAAFLTSQPSAMVFTPNFPISSAVCTQRSFLRAHSTRLAPISARPSAIWRPSPTEPPVMIATRPVRSRSCLTFIAGEASLNIGSATVQRLPWAAESPGVFLGLEPGAPLQQDRASALKPVLLLPYAGGQRIRRSILVVPC